MDTKLAQLKRAAESGDWQKAIAIAAKFPRLGPIRDAVLDAHTAYTNPRWAAAIGRDSEADKAAGQQAITLHYLRPRSQ